MPGTTAATPPGHRRERPAARPRRSRRLILALVVVALAGFLLGLGVPIHP